jgi:hypothetical protein
MFRTLLMRGCFITKLLNSILASPNGCKIWWFCSWCSYEDIEYLTYSFGHVWHLVLIFVNWRSSRLHFSKFWLDSCIVNKGGKVVKEKCLWMHLEGFQVVWAFLGFVCHRSDQSRSPIWLVQVLGTVHTLGTGLTGAVYRFDQSKPSWCNYSVLWRGLHAPV